MFRVPRPSRPWWMLDSFELFPVDRSGLANSEGVSQLGLANQTPQKTRYSKESRAAAAAAAGRVMVRIRQEMMGREDESGELCSSPESSWGAPPRGINPI